MSWSAFTLIPYALVLIQLRVFYAREQAWTPTWIVLGITAVKIALLRARPDWSPPSTDQVVILLGAANGLGYITGAVIGGYLLHRSLGNLQMANVGKTVWSVVLASLAGVADNACRRPGPRTRPTHRDRSAVPDPSFGSAVSGILMLVITFTILYFKKIPEVRSVTVAVSRKIRSVWVAPSQPRSPAPVIRRSAKRRCRDRADRRRANGQPNAVRTTRWLPYPGPGTRSQPAQTRGVGQPKVKERG